MKIVIGTIKDLSSLAILNKRLIEDEKYPKTMNIEELEECGRITNNKISKI